MKIGILTHPLINNYGGILQAFALQYYLKMQGHVVKIIDRRANRSFIKQLTITILEYIGFGRYKKTKEKIVEMQHFIKQNMDRSLPIYSEKGLRKYSKKEAFDAIIVGSDQVWRPDFAPEYKGNYFLDFVQEPTKKISYAASFGLSEWKYSKENTSNIAQQLSSFCAISVREDDAVDLCHKYLDSNVTHVLDPTLLLTQDVYNNVASQRLQQEKYIFVYWLGDRGRLREIIEPFSVRYKIIDLSLRKVQKQISIQDWLSYIKYAEFVVTDSFHGCVFSIIFEKQFKIFTNDSGGNGRLKSLFTMLDIECSFTGTDAMPALDYTLINKELIELRQISEDFINNALLK